MGKAAPRMIASDSFKRATGIRASGTLWEDCEVVDGTLSCLRALTLALKM